MPCKAMAHSTSSVSSKYVNVTYQSLPVCQLHYLNYLELLTFCVLLQNLWEIMEHRK